ncbi:hypothetical protein PCE1_004972 [Barthelona sp. PCE]
MSFPGRQSVHDIPVVNMGKGAGRLSTTQNDFEPVVIGAPSDRHIDREQLPEMSRTSIVGLAVQKTRELDRAIHRMSVIRESFIDLQADTMIKEEFSESTQKDLKVDVHSKSISDVAVEFGTDLVKGMSEEKAAYQLEVDGPNMLSPPEEESKFVKFSKHLTGFFAILLWIGAILSFFGYSLDTSDDSNMFIGVALVVVVLFNAIFSFFQEEKSAEIMKGFLNMIPECCKVTRDGETYEIDATKLVIGDIVDLEAGMKIPADIRVFEVANLKADQSAITGEPIEISKNVEVSKEKYTEAKNLCFYGTLIVEGSGKGVVWAVGDDTFVGRVAELTKQESNAITPIRADLDRFVFIISTIAIVLSLTFLVVGFFLQDWLSSLLFAIGCAVANVPEGLLASISICLSLAARRMAGKNVLVKNLESVETLGSTSVICSDKTGTLTQNKMTLSHMWYNSEMHTVQASYSKGEFSGDYVVDDVHFNYLFRIMALNSRSNFDTSALVHEEFSALKCKVLGDASETAFLRFVGANTDVNEYRDRYMKLVEIPFNSRNKFQFSIHQVPQNEVDVPGGQRMLTMKGAPERIFKRCTHIFLNNEIVPITDEHREKFQTSYEDMAGFGERVLGFGYKMLDEKIYHAEYDYATVVDSNAEHFEPAQQLCFVGLGSLIDPPRESVPDSIVQCQNAGIKVTMVTGDHPHTAEAIAKQIGIITLPVSNVPKPNHAIVVHGDQLDDMDEEQLLEVLRCPEVVFARTTPKQKLDIVQGYQKLNYVVAVTGDGTNDAPALRTANIGVAMGKSGSDVAREAADMVLMDDSFSSIVNGVHEGRVVFDNLKKTIAYVLSSNIPEIVPFLLFVVLGLPLPLSTINILLIDLGSDILPSISLAYERPEADILDRPPRTLDTRLVTAKLVSFSYLQIGVMQALGGLATYFSVFKHYNISAGDLIFSQIDFNNKDIASWNGFNYDARQEILLEAQTACFIAIIIVQYADLAICKTQRLSIFQHGWNNRTSTLGILFETLWGLSMSYVPIFNTVFLTRPLKGVFFLPAIPWAFAIFIYDELRKWIIRRNPKGWISRYTAW